MGCINVPSKSGRFVKSFDEDVLTRLAAEHGDNVFNVVTAIGGWVTLVSDRPHESRSVPNAVFNSFYNELVNDFRQTTKRLSKLSDELLTRLVHTEEGTSPGPFLKELMRTPVSREYLHFYKTLDSVSLQYVLSFLNFGKKLHYVDESLSDSALCAWLEVEERLSELELPAWVDDLAKIVSSLQIGYHHVPLPAHGGGKVAERGVSGVAKKNFVLTMDARAYKVFHHWDMEYRDALVSPEGYTSADMLCSDDVRCSLLMFVAKTMWTKRSVCMEPAHLMWEQQSVRVALELAIKRSPFSRFIHIDDQTFNQEASRFGAVSSLVDTIDLSAASDSVALALVKRIFPRKILKHLLATRSTMIELPDGRIHRSAKFAPMGSAVCFPTQSIIFAAVVVLAACRKLDIRIPENPSWAFIGSIFSETYHFGDDRRFQPLKVYGDDIACDSKLTDTVIGLLHQLGFVVNENKTFRGDSAIRESCGSYHFDGRDVAPFFLRLGRETEHRLSPSRVASFVSSINRSRSYNFHRLSTYLQRTLLGAHLTGVRRRKNRDNPILFSSDQNAACAILVKAPKNFHLRRRSPSTCSCKLSPKTAPPRMKAPSSTLLDPAGYVVDQGVSDEIGLILNYGHRFLERPDKPTQSSCTCCDYQREELRSYGTAPDEVDDIVFDNYDFIQWQRSRGHRSESPPVTAVNDDPNALNMRMSWRWTPA